MLLALYLDLTAMPKATAARTLADSITTAIGVALSLTKEPTKKEVPAPMVICKNPIRPDAAPMYRESALTPAEMPFGMLNPFPSAITPIAENIIPGDNRP